MCYKKHNSGFWGKEGQRLIILSKIAKERPI